MVSFGRKGQTTELEAPGAEVPDAPAPVAAPVMPAPSSRAAFPRVNLIPAEIAAEARVKTAKLVLGGAVAASIAVTAGLYLMASNDVSSAQESLDAARVTSAELATEQTKYADVPRVQSDLLSAQTQQAAAMGGEVRWSVLLNNLALTVPQGASLSSFQASITGTSGAPAANGSSASSSVASILGAPGVGTISYDGEATDSPRLAALLESLGRTPGLIDPWATQVTNDAGAPATAGAGNSATTSKQKRIVFTGNVTIGPKALSHRFDGKGN